MTEYVKKSDVLHELWKADAITYHGIEVLNKMPAENVVENRTGKFISYPFSILGKCSECQSTMDIGDNYCRNCGVRMVGK